LQKAGSRALLNRLARRLIVKFTPPHSFNQFTALFRLSLSLSLSLSLCM